MWAPDLYQGASTPVTMLIASLPKITMVLVLSRIINEVFLKLFLFNEHWQILLIIVSVLSLLIGNVGAMLQTNIKRLLAYSAIGQAGFILLGFAANSIMGRIAANFYVVVYTLIIIGLLGIVTIFSKIDLEEIQDFRGLGKKHPWLGGVLLILLLSMVGIPPTIGFYSKFLIIKSLINANLIWVAIVALLLSVVSLFYCLRIIKIMYFIDDNQDHALNDLDYRNSKFRITTTVSTPLAIVLSINGILALGLGIFPVFINSILIYFG